MRAETAQEYRQRVARAGGHGRAQKLTPEERSDSARKAVEARWAKQKKLVKEITEGSKALLRKAKAAEARLAKRKKEKTPK
jgi:hypothetical protein